MFFLQISPWNLEYQITWLCFHHGPDALGFPHSFAYDTLGIFHAFSFPGVIYPYTECMRRFRDHNTKSMVRPSSSHPSQQDWQSAAKKPRASVPLKGKKEMNQQKTCTFPMSIINFRNWNWNSTEVKCKAGHSKQGMIKDQYTGNSLQGKPERN